jgi:putative DNA primase/helicase
MARIASSEGGKIIKGSSGGGAAAQYEIRSMFCVSSINVALVQGADRDRFCVLSLRRAEGDWDELADRINEYCTEETGRSLVARTLQRIPTIRANARTFATALARNHGQRFGDQHGTLLAGAFSLVPDSDREVSLDEAIEFCDAIDWSMQSKDERDADEHQCLAHICESMVPVEGGKKLTIMNLIESMVGPRMGTLDGSDETADKILGRYGIRLNSGNLLIANSNTNLEKLLGSTQWSGGAHKQALKRVLGADKTPGMVRFLGSKSSRATVIPLTAVIDAD